MKKNLCLLSALLILISAQVFSQLTFSVAPGLNLNSACFGYKTGNFVPFIGIQMMALSGKSIETGTEWDYDTNQPVLFEDESKISGSLIIPTLGVKYFALEKNKLKGYAMAALSKPFFNAKVTFNGEENEELQDMLDKVSLFGGMAGVGVEYFFDENFSIGGEYGILIMTGNYEDEYIDEYYNPNTSTYVDAELSIKLKGKIMPTYAKASLNFYF